MINKYNLAPDLARYVPPPLTWAGRSCQVVPESRSYPCHLTHGPLGPGGGGGQEKINYKEPRS